MPLNPKELEADLRWAICHDRHKMEHHPHRGEKHPPVALNADRDATRMSYHGAPPEPDTDSSDNVFGRYRIDLICRRSFYNAGKVDKRTTEDERKAFFNLCNNAPVGVAFEAWLNAELPAMYNVHPCFQYTSLKYHSAIVTALLYNYKHDHPFNTLCLALSVPPKMDFTTILRRKDFSLHLVPIERIEDFQCGAQIGRIPHMNFHRIWVRLDEHPRISPYLDTYLRQIEGWDTALQLIEDWGVFACF